MRRDPKGLYRRALHDSDMQMPGVGVAYEPPQCPEVIVHSDYEPPEAAAQRIIDALEERNILEAPLSGAPALQTDVP
jgi:adenylylsulfate kinase-like enzyme